MTSFSLSSRSKDFILFCLFFLLYCCIYAVVTFRFGMVMEEVHEGVTVHHQMYISNMRWGVALWRGIFGFGALPLVSGMIAGVAISLSILIQTKIFGIHALRFKLAYAVIYLSGIQWLYQLVYSNQSDVVALSFLACSIAVYLGKFREGWVRCIVPGVLFTFAISCYQSSVIYAVVLSIATYMVALLNGNASVYKGLVKPFIVLIIALMAWWIVAKLLCLTSLTSDSMNKSVASYQHEMIRWSRLEGLSLSLQLRCIFRYFVTVPLSHIFGCNHPCQWVYTSALLPTALILLNLWKTVSWRKFVGVTVLLLIILYLPFAMGAIFVAALPQRVLVAEPLAAACIWGIYFSGSRQLRIFNSWYWCTFLVFCVISAVYAVAAYARTERYCYERAKEELLLMHARGMESARAAGLQECKIILFGDYGGAEIDDYYMNSKSLHLHSVHPHITSGGRAWIPAYAQYLRLPYLQVATEDDVARHSQVVDAMPSWPSIGSVSVHNGDVIIKIGSSAR